MAAVLPLTAVKYLAGHGDVPAMSISDGQDSPDEHPVSPHLTHQPTILKADTALAPPIDESPRVSPAPSTFRGHLTDDRNTTSRKAPPVDFLPIPSLDAPERR